MDKQKVLNKLVNALRNSRGVAVFADNGSKFENWLHVELCGILKKLYPDSEIVVEKRIDTNKKKEGYLDIYFKKNNVRYAIELKVLRAECVKEPRPKRRDYPCNLNGDLIKLREMGDVDKRIILLALFQLTTAVSKQWEQEFDDKLLLIKEFTFKDNKTKVAIYFGEIKT